MIDTLLLHGFNNIKEASSNWISLRLGPNGSKITPTKKWWNLNAVEYVNTAVFDATIGGNAVVVKAHVNHSSRLLISYDSASNSFSFSSNLSVDHVGIFDPSGALLEDHILPTMPKVKATVRRISSLPAPGGTVTPPAVTPPATPGGSGTPSTPAPAPLTATADGVISGSGTLNTPLTLDSPGSWSGGVGPFNTTYRWEHTDPRNPAQPPVVPTGVRQGQQSWIPSVFADEKDIKCITIVQDSTGSTIEIPSNAIHISSVFTEIDPEIRGTVAVGETVDLFSGRLELPVGNVLNASSLSILSCILEVSLDNGVSWQSVQGYMVPAYNNTSSWTIPATITHSTNTPGNWTNAPAVGLLIRLSTIFEDNTHGHANVIAILESNEYTIAAAAAVPAPTPPAAGTTVRRFTTTGSQTAPQTAVTTSGPTALRRPGSLISNKWQANPIPNNEFNGSGVAPYSTTFQWQAADPSSDITLDSSWSDLPGATSSSFLGSTYSPQSDIDGKWIRVVQIVTDSDTPTPTVDHIPGPAIGPLKASVPLTGFHYRVQVKGGGPLQVGSVVELVEVQTPANGVPPYITNITWVQLDNSFDRVSSGHGTNLPETSNELTITAAMASKYISAKIAYQDSSNPPWKGNVAADHAGSSNVQAPLGPVQP